MQRLFLSAPDWLLLAFMLTPILIALLLCDAIGFHALAVCIIPGVFVLGLWMYNIYRMCFSIMYGPTYHFSYALTFSVVYLISFFILDLIIAIFIFQKQDVEMPTLFLRIFVPSLIIAILCSFYCIYALVKVLRMAEGKRVNSFSAMLPDIFLFCCFYAGVPVIQQRVTKLYRTKFSI